MSRLHKPKAGFWIRLCVLIVYPFGGIFFRIRWHHLDRMPDPEKSGVIVVLNHVSHIDTVLMARLVWQSGRIPRFMIKSSLFEVPIVGQIITGAKQIPVYRGTAGAAESLRDAVSALNNGEAIVIYAEGTITQDPDQWPMQAKTGAARLALLAPHIPVVPVGQWGAQQVKTKKYRLFTRRRHQAGLGEPLDMSKWAGAEPEAVTLRTITDEIMTAVRNEVAILRNEKPPADFFKPEGQ